MSRCPVSSKYFEVITISPSVVAVTVAVAPELSPVIVSAVKEKLFVETKLIGLDVLIILPVALLVPPVIFSPLVNVPVIVVKVKVGATASVEVSCESKTPANLNASARPKEISLSPGRVPYASVVPVVTFICFISFVVFVFCVTLVLRIVATSFTFAALPKTVESVIVIEAVPVLLISSAILTSCP